MSVICQFREARSQDTPLLFGVSQDKLGSAALHLHSLGDAGHRKLQTASWLMCEPGCLQRGKAEPTEAAKGLEWHRPPRGHLQNLSVSYWCWHNAFLDPLRLVGWEHDWHPRRLTSCSFSAPGTSQPQHHLWAAMQWPQHICPDCAVGAGWSQRIMRILCMEIM